MSSEIFRCSGCREEKTLYYDKFDTVVSESPCSCNKKPKRIKGLKPLDYAIKQIEVLNEKSYPRSRKIPARRTDHSEE
jgi:hypothetical protein